MSNTCSVPNCLLLAHLCGADWHATNLPAPCSKRGGDLGAYPASPMEELLVWGSAELCSPWEDGLGHYTGSVRIKPFGDPWCGNSDCSPELSSRGKTHAKWYIPYLFQEKKSTVNLQNKKFIFPFAAAVSREDNFESCCHVEVTMGRKDCLMYLSRQLIFLGDTQQPQWAQQCFYHHKSVFSFHLHRAEVMWDLAFEMFPYRSGVVFPQT